MPLIYITSYYFLEKIYCYCYNYYTDKKNWRSGCHSIVLSFQSHGRNPLIHGGLVLESIGECEILQQALCLPFPFSFSNFKLKYPRLFKVYYQLIAFQLIRIEARNVSQAQNVRALIPGFRIHLSRPYFTQQFPLLKVWD